jgi:hypothetical protein
MAVQAETLSVSSTYTGHLTNGDPTKAAAIYKPTHPDLFEVQFRDGEYNSCLVALKVRAVRKIHFKMAFSLRPFSFAGLC